MPMRPWVSCERHEVITLASRSRGHVTSRGSQRLRTPGRRSTRCATRLHLGPGRDGFTPGCELNLFNTLTGYGHPERQEEVLVAPGSMREPLLEEIERTIAAHKAGEPARIVMKMNALVDQRCIEALYRASQAGVPIELNVRGICCLIPGVPGVSETINVVSVVGRFLEHSRIYSFHRGEHRTFYIGSADLMPRNLDTRVELLAPVEDEELQDTLERCLADNTFAWTLDADGRWNRKSGRTRSVQLELMQRTLAQVTTAAS